jgi:tetratricopeptide (TPR) repeat protein
MRRTVLWALAALVLGPPLWADPPPKDESAKKLPAQQYRALLDEYQKAQQAFSAAYRAAKTDEERQKVFDKYPEPGKYAPRFLKLAEDNPKDPAALDALVWVVSAASHTPEASKALDQLLRDHLESLRLGQVCQALRYSPGTAADKLLREALEKNPNREVKAHAGFTLGFRLARQAEAARQQNPADADKLTREAEDLLERVARDASDVKSYRGSLADAARAQLFEIRNLAIGKQAPEIEGEDVDGKPFKLSDYKGKVVVLDFWGNW